MDVVRKQYLVIHRYEKSSEVDKFDRCKWVCDIKTGKWCGYVDLLRRGRNADKGKVENPQ